jgi:L-fuconate dehydratase
VDLVSATFSSVDISDVRFPTSVSLVGSDALNTDPDYSAAYAALRTTDGDAGYGFVFTLGRGNDVAVAALAAVADLVVGMPVDEALANLGAFSRRLTHDSHLRWLGPEKGVMHMAIGAVVNAAWDLAARRAGKPLWRLLTELSPRQIVDLVDFRHLSDALTRDEALAILERSAAGKDERVSNLLARGYPAYSTSAGWLGYSDAKVAHLLSQAVASGFTHLKFKVGFDIEADVRRLKMVRDLVGPDILLSVDANQSWDVPEAIANIQRLAAYSPYWVEEPTSPDDVIGHRRIAQAVAPTLVATGEHVPNRIVFKQLLASGAIGVCQVDACRVAGVNENIAIMLLAAKFGVPVCPHAGGVGLCEVVQHLAMFDYVAVSGSTEGRWIEYIDHLHEYFEDPVRVANARYRAPRAPGSGAALLPGAIAEFSFPSGPAWVRADRTA